MTHLTAWMGYLIERHGLRLTSEREAEHPPSEHWRTSLGDFVGQPDEDLLDMALKLGRGLLKRRGRDLSAIGDEHARAVGAAVLKKYAEIGKPWRAYAPPPRQEEQMTPSTTPNPYDRRQDRGTFHESTQATTDTDMVSSPAEGRLTRLDLHDRVDTTKLTLEDLGEFVEAKANRARYDGAEIERERAAEPQRQALRGAWDSGHAAGELDGLMAYWELVEKTLAERIIVVQEEARTAVAEDPKRRTKDEYRDLLQGINNECENMLGLFRETLRPDVFIAERARG